MNRDIDINEPDHDPEQHTSDAKQLRSALIKEVLLWEAT